MAFNYSMALLIILHNQFKPAVLLGLHCWNHRQVRETMIMGKKKPLDDHMLWVMTISTSSVSSTCCKGGDWCWVAAQQKDYAH